MDYEKADGYERETVDLGGLSKSPKLAELKVSYRSRSKAAERPVLRNSEDAEAYLRGVWNWDLIELVEEFVVVCLNGGHQATGWARLSTGGLNASFVDLRLVFGVALQTASSALIVAHNHPSGSLEVSEEDKRTTRKLVEAGKVLGITVLDHLILTRERAVSLREAGWM